jgi:hypothetical protein
MQPLAITNSTTLDAVIVILVIIALALFIVRQLR